LCIEGAKLKALKEVFPGLRNFEGRFFDMFLAELETRVEDWAIWARLELGKKKCSNIYTTDVLCASCAYYQDHCVKYPELGQTWEGIENATLQHPNTEEWYWCIKECPDYARKE
jgi:hypothetical protein